MHKIAKLLLIKHFTKSIEPQIYSLDRMVSLICDVGNENEFKRELDIVFPSFTNVNNFHYINDSNTWSEFKTKLLPAISKTYQYIYNYTNKYTNKN